MNKWAVLNSLTQHGVVRLKTALEYFLKEDFDNDFINSYDYKFGLVGDSSVEYGYWNSAELFSEHTVGLLNSNDNCFVLTLQVTHNQETVLEVIINPLWDLKHVAEMQKQMRKNHKHVFIKDGYVGHRGVTQLMYEIGSRILVDNTPFTQTILNLDNMKQYYNNLEDVTDLDFYISIHENKEEFQQKTSLTVNDLVNKYNTSGTIITFILEYTRNHSSQTQTLYLDNHEHDFVTNLIITYLFINKDCFVSKSSNLSAMNLYNMKKVNYAMNGVFNYKNLLLNEDKIFYSMYLKDNMPYEQAFKYSGYSLTVPQDIILPPNKQNQKNQVKTNPLE